MRNLDPFHDRIKPLQSATKYLFQTRLRKIGKVIWTKQNYNGQTSETSNKICELETCEGMHMQMHTLLSNITSILCLLYRGSNLKSYLFALKCIFFALPFLQTDLTPRMRLYFSTHLVFRKHVRLYTLKKRAKLTTMIFEFTKNVFRFLTETLWCKKSVFSGLHSKQRTIFGFISIRQNN